MKGLETFDFSGAMERHQRKIKRVKGGVILKILGSQEGDLEILDDLCPVGNQLGL